MHMLFHKGVDYFEIEHKHANFGVGSAVGSAVPPKRLKEKILDKFNLFETLQPVVFGLLVGWVLESIR